MLKKMKTLPTKYIGVGLCGFIALYSVIFAAKNIISGVDVYYGVYVYYISVVIAMVAFIVPAFVKLKIPFSIRTIGFGVLTVYQLYLLISNFDFVIETFEDIKYGFIDEIASAISLPILLAAFAFAFVLSINKIKPFAKLPTGIVWVVPAALFLIGGVFLSFPYIYYGSFVYFIKDFWYYVVFAAAMLFTMYEELDIANYVAPEAVSSEGGYNDLGKHILLIFLTCGIYLFIWIYRTTIYTNKVTDEPQRNPVNKLLLCMFVPFYYIYWICVTAQRIEKLAKAKGKSADIATVTLILAIFVNVAAPIFMQMKINEIETPAPQTQYGAPVYNTPAQPQYTPPAYNTPAQTVDTPAAVDETPIAQETPVTQSSVANDANDIADGILRFKQLLDDGVITQEEFDAKKKQLLGL